MRTVALGEIAEIVSGATPKTSVAEFWNGEVEWATPADLSKLDGAYISATPRKITQAAVRSCATTILPKNSVLLSSRAPIGHVAINTVPMATNQGFKSLVPGPGLDAKYLYHWLKSKTDYLQSLGNGATFKELSRKTTERIQVPLPPLTEQRRIAAILDRADALRASRQQTLKSITSLAHSIFDDMFGDPTVASAGWQLKTIAEVAGKQKHSIVDGPFGSALSSSDYVEAGIPVVRIKNISPEGELLTKDLLFIRPEKFDILKRSSLQAGDVLVSRVGTLGNSCVFPDQFGDALLSTTGVCKITVDRSIMSPHFLHAAIRTPPFQRQIESSASTSVQKYFNLSALRAWSIVVPPLADQQVFAERVSRVRARRAAMHHSLEQTDRLFASLQSRAFRGEL